MEMTPSQQSSQGNAAPKYTTVGSVWHPQTTPMQPPTRRGRTLRSVAPEPLDHAFSATPHQPAHYYSPLQQNFDRAVSPLPPDRQLFARIPELGEKPSLYSTTMSQQSTDQHSPSNELVLAAKQDEDIEDHQEDNGSDIEDDLNLIYLNRMPTKSLTNLASYDNPMQKAAQKLLTRARQFPLSITPQTSDITQENRSLLPPPGFGPGFKYNRSDPLGAEGLVQSDRADESGLPIQPMRQYNPNISDSASHERDTYPAVLSKGPGAPLPLTAGPPGQRQFPSSTYNSANAFQKGPSAFDSSTNHWQKGFDQSRGFDSFEDATPRPPQYPFTSFNSQQVTQPMGTSQQPTPSLLSRAPSAQQYPAMNMDRESSVNIKMIDTLTYEEAKKFYPNGFPASFNQSYRPVPDNWVELRLKELEDEEKAKNQIAMQHTREWQAAHQAQLHRDFYSGNAMINKDFGMAVHEKNSRDIAHAVGSFQEFEKAPGRVDNRQLSLSEINEIPTHEHAKPLLSVMYQSLANNPNITPHRSLPKYVVPPKKKKTEDSTEAEGSQ
ncbi:hypothetical protein F5Y02DRAFT_251328 [Annulohypoxylon stygium]|nr:hypothetical protein F5Y02DRAFT_251328 [Annulohypoxylon stygium]